MEDDNDEVVILSDVRPLEPYVVDLSGSSDGEDDTEDILPLTDQFTILQLLDCFTLH